MATEEILLRLLNDTAESVRIAVVKRLESKGGSEGLARAVTAAKAELEIQARAREEATRRHDEELQLAREGEERRAAELARQKAEQTEREAAIARNERERARLEALRAEAEDRNNSRLAALIVAACAAILIVSFWVKYSS